MDTTNITSDNPLGAHMRDCLRYIDEKTLERFGAPLYAGLIQFPHRHEIVNFASNGEIDERDKFAQAMIELLIRWGYLRR
jgi:hypothetical protein